MSPDPYDLDRIYDERQPYYAGSPSPHHLSAASPVDHYVTAVVLQAGMLGLYTSAAVVLVQLLLTVSEYFTLPHYKACDYGRSYPVLDFFLYTVPSELYRSVVLPVENIIARGDAKQIIRAGVGPMTDIVLNAIEEVATKWEPEKLSRL